MPEVIKKQIKDLTKEDMANICKSFAVCTSCCPLYLSYECYIDHIDLMKDYLNTEVEVPSNES